MEKFETRLTRFAIRHPRRTAFLAAVLAIFCVAVIVLRARIDSDVLNLLPQRFESVQGLKLFDRDFSQARELTFALWDESGKGKGDLDAFADYFGEALRREPWVVRVMDGVPMESPEGIAQVQKLAVPLLLNLPPGDFDKALEHLQPSALAARFKRKRAEIEAGSFKAEMELNFDPTGVVIPALKPLAGSFSLEGGADGARPFASPDGTLRVAIAVTRQEKLDAPSCQELMRKVEAFKARVLAGWKSEGGSGSAAPQILVTGRTPYVAEMSLGMRGDIVSTVIGSVVLVAGIFWLGFRRVRPLFAILHVLLLCCLVAVAAGTFIFGQLNVVTMGICAIMVGIGVDFGMLLFGTYQAAREEGQDHEAAAAHAVNLLGRGVLFGAATAAASFSALILSESPGFTQLGVLIGVGVLTAALLMMTVFFALLGRGSVAGKRDFLSGATFWYVERLHRRAGPVAIAGLAALLALNLYAWLPVGKVRLEADPKSLEPAESRAGFALRKITEKLPAAKVEPVLAIIQGRDAADFRARWTKAQEHWLVAKEKGEIRSFTSPWAFALAPERLKANLAHLRGLDFAPARTALTGSLEREGFEAASFQGAFGLLDSLGALAHGDLAAADWRKALPEDSSWIFILDRFLSPTPNVGLAYISPQKTISSQAEQQRLRTALDTPGLGATLTGWSYVMADLVPWSKVKLRNLSLAMLGFIVVVLVFLYRSPAPLLVLLGSLGLSIGAMVAGLKLTGLSLNLFNMLAFPLCLGVGVDYGIYTVLGVRQRGGPKPLATVIKPVILSGLTTIAGFASLGFATHPALSSLGLVCALGVACCLFSTLFFILPVYLWRGFR